MLTTNSTSVEGTILTHQSLTPCLPRSVGNHRAARATSLETEISDYAIVYLCYKLIDVYSKPKLVVVAHLVPKL